MPIDQKDPLVVDQYSFLDYKGAISGGRIPHQPESWIPDDDMRRLRAYMILESYCRNSAREWLNISPSSEGYQETKDNRREYGDPHIVVQTALSSLMGEDQSVIVEAATGKAPNTPEHEYLTKILEWAGDEGERLVQKMFACEENAVKLGDGVYVLGWSENLGRPVLRVWDPGFYFPVWDEEDPSEEFSKCVHIAYDFERENALGEKEKFLRRITWELVPLVDAEGNPASIPESERPWNGKGDTTETVLFSDMVWRYEDVSKDQSEGPVYTLDLTKAHEVTAEEEDLEIDWIPVIHVTNTSTDAGERFGISVLSPVMQIVDDIISTDTDLQAASATTGSPPLVVPDLAVSADDDNSIRSYGPGEVISTTGDAGGATMIDTSKSLVALTNYVKDLLSRMSVNGRIPESLLGRIKPNEVPSGITLTLSFAPHSSMVRAMRLVRKPKYPLLLKMVGRFFMQNGDIKQIFPARVEFGSFLPAHRQEVTTIIVALFSAKVISLETCVTMMVEAGFPIESIPDEIKRIQERDLEGANTLLGITADVNVARKYLGLPLVPTQQQQVDQPQNDLPPDSGVPAPTQ